MAGQKFSEAIFNITRPVSLLSDPHFFARVRILPLLGNASIFPFTCYTNPSRKQLTLILFTPVGIWDGIMFGSISNCFLCFGIYPRILGEVHKSIDLFYSLLICNGILTFSILKTRLFGTEKE